MNLIHKAGLLVVRDGCILLCRKKRNRERLILPGGKFEDGETAAECLLREIREELGPVRLSGLEHVGTYTDQAVEAGKQIRVELYSGDLEGTPAACSEIAELVWFGQAGDRCELAPSLANRIIPDLVSRGILRWV
jgi:8-oxo-dGTP pyrophosphatase MutT (NUDIX family)